MINESERITATNNDIIYPEDCKMLMSLRMVEDPKVRELLRPYLILDNEIREFKSSDRKVA